MTTSAFRLPRILIPSAYEIDIDASPRRVTFSGTVKITLRAQQRVDAFELHGRELKITKAAVRGAKARYRPEVVTHPERETIALCFGAPLPAGKLQVILAFKGRLNPSMRGLYLARDGREKAIVSQCEATDARAIFPCFDEPDLKATLQWRVRTDPGFDVITNGPLRSRRKAGQRTVWSFAPTKAIPTYLAALTIGRYEFGEPQRVARTTCQIAAGRGKAGLTNFAQEVTARVLPWYVKYFGSPYAFAKLDQVAVPGFDAGAMENSGAIFYRQSLLLSSPATASWFAKKRIAEVIAHEIAHQWFGNLVTMQWWDDLWLNEAFATWVAFKAVADWQPGWRMWDGAAESKESALAADALVNTHPIFTPVATPAEATELFDLITYEKGCAVLRMAESFLGEEAFRAGIQSYIKKFKAKNATRDDLWASLAAASEVPVGPLMKSWITQEGFPLVSARAVADGDRTGLQLQQKRFFADPEKMATPDDTTWQIPLVVSYGTASGRQTARFLLRERDESVTLPARALWVYANAGSVAFYRLEFDAADLDTLLLNGLDHLVPEEKKSLVDDQWALVRNGRSHIARFLTVVKALAHEEDYLVVRAVASRLTYVAQRLVRERDRPAFVTFVRALFAPQLLAVGWEPVPGEPPEQAVRRAAVIDLLGDVGRDPDVLAEAEKQAARERQDPTALEPNLAGTIVALAAVRGDRRLLDQYLAVYQKRHRENASPEVRSRYLYAMAYFEAEDVVRQVLELCLDGTVPQEQLRLVLSALLLRNASQRLTWSFMKERWAEIGVQAGAMSVSRLVEATGALPVELSDEVASFFADNPVPEAKRALKQALESIALRQQLIAQQADRLRRFLADQDLV